MQPGEIIDDRYLIEDLAGKGGMGHVYRCVDTHQKTLVAVKVLSRLSDDSARRFEREAEILAGLSYPGVVRYLAQGYHENAPYLVMEWLAGESLAERLARAPLRVVEALDVALHAADALALIHQQGVVHRDIKPSNIFLVHRETTHIKLLDFGIARLSKEVDLTKTGLLLGSPGYLAPEQARGDKHLDASADIFALGSVLFECLTGRPPFIASHAIAVLVKVLFEEIPRLRAFRPTLPEALERVVAKMLDKAPSGRYPNGAAVSVALRQLASFDEEATHAQAPLRPAALTHDEQRLLGVVLLLDVFAPSSQETTADTGDVPTLSLSREEAPTHAEGQRAMNDASRLILLRELTARFEGRAEPLADGSMVVSIWSQGEAIDQASRAALCALALRKALPRTSMSLALGVGALAPSPFGAVVDRAAALLAPRAALDLQRPTIQIDETTASLLEQRFHLRRSGPLCFLEAERSHEASARTLLGRPSPFVGREAELAQIERAFHESIEASTPRVLLVTAPAGLGKSRLRAECMKRLPALSLLAKGDPLSAGASLSMLAKALRAAALVQEDDPAPERFRKVAAFVTRYLETAGKQEPYPKARRLAEFLAELAQTPNPNPSIPLQNARQDPTLMGDQLRRAFLDWLSLECLQQPVVLLLEDLHWADLATIQLINTSLQQLQHLPLLVLAFARPEAKERFPQIWELRGLEELSLRPLPASSCRELIQSFLGERLPQAKLDEMIELSQGNAFYLEELIRALREGRAEQLPASIVAMAQARIDSLPEASRHLLRAASVFGESFVLPSLLPMLVGVVSERELRQQLSWLWGQEVLTRAPSERERYHFRHALVREAAYAKLTPQDRALAHRFAAQWLEAQEHPEAFVVAEHWRQGDEPRLAASWYAVAAKVSLEGNDLPSALRLAELALQLGVSEEHLPRLHTIRAEAHGWLGQPQQASAAWQDNLAISVEGSPAWYSSHAGLFMASLQLRDFERALALIENLQGLSPQAEAATDSAMALTIVVSFSCVGGLYSVASAFIEKFEASPTARTEAENWISLGWRNQAYAYGALYVQGDPWEYLQRAQTAKRYLEKAGHVRGALAQAVEVGRAYLNLGAFAEAERLLREKLSQISQLQLQYLSPFAKLFLGQSLRCQQQYEEAKSLTEQALAEFAKTGHGPKQGDSRAELGKILLEQNDLDAAHAQLQQALPLLAFALPAKSKATAVLSLIRLSQGEAGEALELSQETLDLLDGLGGQGYEDIYLYWARVEALLANQRTREAKDVLYEAKRRLLLRADRIPDPNYRESFLGAVEENRKILALAQQFRL